MTAIISSKITREQKINFILLHRYGDGTRHSRVLADPDAKSLKMAPPSPELLAAEAVLEGMSDEQLDVEYNTVVGEVARLLAARLAREEAGRPFNQPNAKADFSHWAKYAYWEIYEAVALVLWRDPKVVTWESLRSYAKVSPFVGTYDRLVDLAFRAVASGQLAKHVGPGAFIAWAKRYDIAVPAELEAAVANYGHFVGDWKTLYDTAKLRLDEALAREIEVTKAAFALNQEMETLKERVASLRPLAPASARPEKPADPREIESLQTMLIALSMRGYGYDPREKRSDKIADIVADVESLGLSLDRDTVRRHLKAAAELVPPEAFEKPKK